MNNLKLIGLLSVFLLFIFIEKTVFQEGSLRQISSDLYVESNAPVKSYEIMAKRDLLALMMAYPGCITDLEKGEQNTIYVIMKSGNKIVYDDLKVKKFEDKLVHADLQDMMEQVYPLSAVDKIMENNVDPGRIRVYRFINEVYGRKQSEIERNLINVSLGSKNFSFNKNNNAASSLKAAFAELSALCKRNPKIYGFVYPVNGTYNYRVIAGTSQLSPHSFGIAIDLKSNKNDYWRWATEKQGQSRMDEYPRELVQVLEKHNFIWGGKWAHFDFLHFEYRPELIIKAQYYCDPDQLTGPWYTGYPDTELTRNYINTIEHAFQ